MVDPNHREMDRFESSVHHVDRREDKCHHKGGKNPSSEALVKSSTFLLLLAGEGHANDTPKAKNHRNILIREDLFAVENHTEDCDPNRRCLENDHVQAQRQQTGRQQKQTKVDLSEKATSQ